jgi:hypothetical protein
MKENSRKLIIIGVISDTHIPSRTSEIPSQIIEEFKKRNVDFIFHLGDYTELDVYERLKEMFGEEKVIGISGNMDGNEVNSTLPTTRELELMGYKIFLTHGSGGPNRIIKRLNRDHDLSTYDIVIFGHVHKPINEKHNGILYLNPGTPTDKRFADMNSYGFLTLSHDGAKFEIIQL